MGRFEERARGSLARSPIIPVTTSGGLSLCLPDGRNLNDVAGRYSGGPSYPASGLYLSLATHRRLKLRRNFTWPWAGLVAWAVHAARRASLIAALALAVTACTPTPPAPSVIAPYPQQYTCEQSRQAGREFAALPADSMLRVMVTDYGELRRELRELHHLPEPPKCR